MMIPPITILNYVNDNPEVVDGQRLGDRVYHAGLQGGIGLWGTVMTLFLRRDRQQAENFAELLMTGANMTAGHPALVLRNRLISAPKGAWQSHADREKLVAMVIKAWNAYRQQRTINQLVWKGEGARAEPFPEAI